MQVICQKINSRDFDLKEVTTIFSNDFDYGFGGYGLEKGKEYIVMGMTTRKDSNCLYYLIDVHGRPDFFPYLLFSISNHSISKNWFVKVNDKNTTSDIYFICGFYELCKDEDYYDQLLGRDSFAMEVYFKRKIQMEQELKKERM